jgi:diadenosine tetraphosphatase ApaH/serine/threonine PP2A family protein phosphatase
VVNPEPTSDGPRARLALEFANGERAGVWHPSKQWALVKTPVGWLTIVACRELRTLRRIEPLVARVHAWTQMLAMGMDAKRRTGLGLDLNPANFAFDSELGGLFYLDEEFYPAFGLQQIASAIVARIPEEPEAPEDTWREWGYLLHGALCISAAEREMIVEEALSYPLVETYGGARIALIEGFRKGRDTVRPGIGKPTNGLVCVLADVHGNLPALEAVISAACENGATSFLFLGDAVGYGPHPRECVARLAELGGVAVRGNHDHAVATGLVDAYMNTLARACAEWTRASLGPTELAWLLGLPLEHRGDGWMAVHGAPRDPHRLRAYVYDLTFEDNLKHLRGERVPLCFHGHTHVQLVHAELPGGPTKLPFARRTTLSPRNIHLVNPGSVGQPRDGDSRAAFALWDPLSGRLELCRVPYRVELTIRDLARAGLPPDLAKRLALGS